MGQVWYGFDLVIQFSLFVELQITTKIISQLYVVRLRSYRITRIYTTNQPPLEQHYPTVERKKTLAGRNLHWKYARGGRPSALTSWAEWQVEKTSNRQNTGKCW